MPPISPRVRAALIALFVTRLWSTSWVIIKFGLKDIPALTFAGLRYGLAFVCLLPAALRPTHVASLRGRPRTWWLRVMLLGVLFYAVTQGAQFVGLAYLPAMTVNLMLNFTTVLVAFMGIRMLGERPSAPQWLGIGVFAAGVLLYFYPAAVPSGEAFGMAVVGLGVVANALSSVLGRHVNRDGDASPLAITTASMGMGAALLLVAGLAGQELPRLGAVQWGYIVWLAVVNTAVAFTLWNHSLRTLSAMESSIINGTMLIQIAVLAWVFLGERLSGQQIAGMVLVGMGAIAVQWRGGTKREPSVYSRAEPDV